MTLEKSQGSAWQLPDLYPIDLNQADGWWRNSSRYGGALIVSRYFEHEYIFIACLYKTVIPLSEKQQHPSVSLIIDLLLFSPAPTTLKVSRHLRETDPTRQNRLSLNSLCTYFPISTTTTTTTTTTATATDPSPFSCPIIVSLCHSLDKNKICRNLHDVETCLIIKRLNLILGCSYRC